MIIKTASRFKALLQVYQKYSKANLLNASYMFISLLKRSCRLATSDKWPATCILRHQNDVVQNECFEQQIMCCRLGHSCSPGMTHITVCCHGDAICTLNGKQLLRTNIALSAPTHPNSSLHTWSGCVRSCHNRPKSPGWQNSGHGGSASGPQYRCWSNMPGCIFLPAAKNLSCVLR